MKAIDKLGREIRPGNFIVYGHALGRCAALQIGIVLEVKTKKDWRDKDAIRVVVWAVDDQHCPIGEGGTRKQGWGKLKPLSRKSTLYFPERMTIVPADDVPQDVRDILLPLYVAATVEPVGK